MTRYEICYQLASKTSPAKYILRKIPKYHRAFGNKTYTDKSLAEKKVDYLNELELKEVQSLKQPKN